MKNQTYIVVTKPSEIIFYEGISYIEHSKKIQSYMTAGKDDMIIFMMHDSILLTKILDRNRYNVIKTVGYSNPILPTYIEYINRNFVRIKERIIYIEGDVALLKSEEISLFFPKAGLSKIRKQFNIRYKLSIDKVNQWKDNQTLTDIRDYERCPVNNDASFDNKDKIIMPVFSMLGRRVIALYEYLIHKVHAVIQIIKSIACFNTSKWKKAKSVYLKQDLELKKENISLPSECVITAAAIVSITDPKVESGKNEKGAEPKTEKETKSEAQTEEETEPNIFKEKIPANTQSIIRTPFEGVVPSVSESKFIYPLQIPLNPSESVIKGVLGYNNIRLAHDSISACGTNFWRILSVSELIIMHDHQRTQVKSILKKLEKEEIYSDMELLTGWHIIQVLKQEKNRAFLANILYLALNSQEDHDINDNKSIIYYQCFKKMTPDDCQKLLLLTKEYMPNEISYLEDVFELLEKKDFSIQLFKNAYQVVQKLKEVTDMI